MKTMNKITWLISFGVLALFVIGMWIGSTFDADISQIKDEYVKQFDNFREVYHNDYITRIKMLIQDCTDIADNSLVVVKHLVSINNKHLGIMYKCSSSDNISMQVQYTKQFYEVF